MRPAHPAFLSLHVHVAREKSSMPTAYLSSGPVLGTLE